MGARERGRRGAVVLGSGGATELRSRERVNFVHLGARAQQTDLKVITNSDRVIT